MKIHRTCLLNCLGGVLLFCAAGVMAIQANRIARLRGANERLRGAEREVQGLRRQNQQIPRLQEETATMAGLRAANKDLLAVRNEIQQLRGRKTELAETRAENEFLLAEQQAVKSQAGASALPVGTIRKTALADAGLGSPEATVQTFFWAMCSGNLERMARCYAVRWPDLVADGESSEKLAHARDMLRQVGLEAPGQSVEELRQELLSQTRCFPGYRITGQKSISPGEVEIGVQCLDGGEVMKMRLRSPYTTIVRPGGLPEILYDEWNIGE